MRRRRKKEGSFSENKSVYAVMRSGGNSKSVSSAFFTDLLLFHFLRALSTKAINFLYVGFVSAIEKIKKQLKMQKLLLHIKRAKSKMQN